MSESLLKVIWGFGSSCLLSKNIYDLKLFSFLKIHYWNLLHEKKASISEKKSKIIYLKNEERCLKNNYKIRSPDLKDDGSNIRKNLTIKCRCNLGEGIIILHSRNKNFNKLYFSYYSTIIDNNNIEENLKNETKLREKKKNVIDNGSDKKIEKTKTVEINEENSLEIDTSEEKKNIYDNTNKEKDYEMHKNTERDDTYSELLNDYKSNLELKYIKPEDYKNYKISKVKNSNKIKPEGILKMNISNNNNEKYNMGKNVNSNNNENNSILYDNNLNNNYNSIEELKGNGGENSKLKKNEIKKILNIIFCSSIPMIGFGFMDQFIMIRLGDIFDASLGVSFGISTLGAASFGQLCSDTFGIFFGYFLNYLLQKYKVIEPAKYDIKNKVYQYCTLIGSVLGILLGCSIGMLQLIFIDTSKNERLKKKKELDFIFQMVMCDCPNILNCETSTLFLYDKAKNELWSKAIHGRKNIIKIPVSSNEKSFNLWVLKNKEIINCKNVLNDERYNPLHDEKFNFKTRTILAAPILDKNNDVVGVLMFLNKLRSHGGYFTRDDEKLVEMMCKHISIFMEKFNYISEGDKKMIIFDKEENTQEEEQEEDECDEVDSNLNFQKEKREREEMKISNIKEEKKEKRKKKRNIIQHNISQIEEDEKIFDEVGENEKEKKFDEEYYDEKIDDDGYDEDEDEEDDEYDDKVYYDNEEKDVYKLDETSEKLNEKHSKLQQNDEHTHVYELNREENEENSEYKLDIKEKKDKLNEEEKEIEKKSKQINEFLIENYLNNSSYNSNNNNDNNNNYKNNVDYNYNNKDNIDKNSILIDLYEKINDININSEKDIIKDMNQNFEDKFEITNTDKSSDGDALSKKTFSGTYNSKKKNSFENINNNNINIRDNINNNNNSDDINNKINNNDNGNNKNDVDNIYNYNNSKYNSSNINNDIYSEQKSLNLEMQNSNFSDINNRSLISFILHNIKIIDMFFDNIQNGIYLFHIKKHSKNINLTEKYKTNDVFNSKIIFERVNFEKDIDNSIIEEKKEYMNNNYKLFLNENLYNFSTGIINKINKEVIKIYMKIPQQVENLLFKKKIMLDDVVKLYSSNTFDESYFSHMHFEKIFNNVLQKKIDMKNLKMLKNIYRYSVNKMFSNNNKYIIVKKKKKLRKFCYIIKNFDIYRNKDFWFFLYCQNSLKKMFFKNLNLIINLQNSCIIDFKLINNYLLNKIYENILINHTSPNICYNIKTIDLFFKENLYLLNNNMCDIIYKYIIFYYCRKKKTKKKNFNYYNYQDLYIGEIFFGQNTHTKKVPKIPIDDLGKKSEIITIDR